MSDTTKMPVKIYLQLGDDDSEWPGEIVWKDVTWCEEQIFESDQLYIRSDLVKKIEKQRDELLAALNVCADKFHDYAELHSMKEPTPENIEKLERNLAMSRMCDAAIARVKGNSA